MSAAIYEQGGYHYDLSPGAHSRESNYFLTGLLDTKQGTCQDMSVLYIAVAQRAGLHVYAVEAPQHVFVRIVTADQKLHDIDTATNTHSNDDIYIQQFQLPAKGLESGAYLRTLNYRELLGLLL